MSQSGLMSQIKVPNEEDPGNHGEGCKLWVGNLDSRVTEFSLLKLLQKYGNLRKFDFLYHKSGPDQEKPRGYCFVSYYTREEAEKAIKGLDGKLALSKKILVRWAHAEKNEPAITYPSTGPASTVCRQPTLSTESKIRAIESKLKTMERGKDDFTLTNQETVSRLGNQVSGFKTVASKPSDSRPTHGMKTSNQSQSQVTRHFSSSAPYHKRDRDKK